MPASGAPLGLGPFGLGTPVAAPLPATTPPAISRYINPSTGDYQQNVDTGQLQDMPPIRQRMLLMVLTRKGTSTVLPNLGITVPPKIDQTFVRKLSSAIRSAARQMTTVERSARIDNIIIEHNITGRPDVIIEFTDLTKLNEADREESVRATL